MLIGIVTILAEGGDHSLLYLRPLKGSNMLCGARTGTDGSAISVVLPKPTARQPIGTISLHLVDRSRHDPWVASQSYRELMVSVWYPAEKSDDLPTAPQMTPLAAADFDTTTAAELGITSGRAGSEGHTREADPSWKSFWDNSTGWKRELRFTGAQHLSFTDFQAFLPQLAGKMENLPTAQLIGTIDPRRSISAQRAYITAFFDLHLKGQHTRLFDVPSGRYPDVKLIP